MAILTHILAFGLGALFGVLLVCLCIAGKGK